MEPTVKKLKLNIKGNIRNYLSKLFLKRKLHKMGVAVHDITDHSMNHVEVVVSGEKHRLWDVVNLTKTQEIFFSLNEVVFEFADVEVPSSV